MIQRTLAFYYGPGELDQLSQHDMVVLQPGHFAPAELERLRDSGTLTLAYLSLGQDAGPPMPWHTGVVDPVWSTRHVDVRHPAWIDDRCREAKRVLDAGFAGLFLDTLDNQDTGAGESMAMLALVARIRAGVGGAYLLANRGFALFPELVRHVQGVVFESFSTTWTLENGLCTVLSPETLDRNSLVAKWLATFDVERFSLDYVHNHDQVSFVRARALLHGMSWTVGNRALTSIPCFRNSLGVAEAGLNA